MSRKKFTYSGCDNLEVMSEAVHYNNYLISLITNNTNGNIAKKKILDFGAGSGTYADLLGVKGIRVDCLEPDETLQKLLAKKGYKVLPDSNSLKPNSYDVIYALNVLEHIEDDKKIIQELSSALKKGGTLVIYVPAFQALYTSMDKKVGHFRRYRKARLKNFAEAADLDVAKLHYCDPVGFAAAAAYKLVGSKDGTISMGSVKFYDGYIFPISKIVQPVFKPLFGKNVVLVAKK